MRIDKLTITNFRLVESAEIVRADQNVFVRQHNHGKTHLIDSQDDVDNQREQLIARIEGKLTHGTDRKTRSTSRWRLQ